MAAVPTIEIGVPGNKLRVSRIGLGTMDMFPVYGETNDEEAINALNHTLNIGCTLWDTANVYGIGHNEQLLSRVPKERRDKFFIRTKFGAMSKKSSHECVIWLFQNAHHIAVVQTEYSAWSTHVETDGLLDACRELGATIVVYLLSGRGFMAGQVCNVSNFPEGDWSRNSLRFKPEHFENNHKLADAFAKMTKKHDSTPGELALAWLLAQYMSPIAIPNTKKTKCLDKNFAASQISTIDNELKELRQLVDSANMQEAHY
ncbi:hypothetical protein EDC05_002542 [Coemansia umbellata]|uniref:NADP-dependent oxidoreductase domain-containing protein n=1 Tax=Coemansia umbellata TaxID=1424467 RepID=A0ABQ8PR31_9FUNG|nr:hypothetical protein EDC05_002542 [Coemansia umbellata]